MIDKARSKFAINAERGIQYVVKHELIEDSPKEIANFLLHCGFLDRARIGEYLTDQRNSQVLDCYLNLIPMTDQSVEVALRNLLMRFKIPGEAQQIDRLLDSFADHYYRCNPTNFVSKDPIYILAFSMILLNTDLHNPNNPCRMTKVAFISNNKSIPGTTEITDKALSEIYDSIARQELTVEKEGIFDYPLSGPDIEGFLWKKSDRFYAWNRRWCVVANHCLYYFYHKNDKSPRGVIPLENLVVRALDRRKKFRFAITARSVHDLLPGSGRSGESQFTSISTTDDQSIFALSLPPGSAYSTIFVNTSQSITSLTSLTGTMSLQPSSWSTRQSRPRKPSLPLIKSAKYVGGQLVEGKRDSYLFQCISQEERDRWVQALNNCIQPPSAIILTPPHPE